VLQEPADYPDCDSSQSWPARNGESADIETKSGGRSRANQLVELAELAPEKQAHGDGDEPSFNPWQEDLYRTEPEPQRQVQGREPAASAKPSGRVETPRLKGPSRAQG
jgi:hypothetical protein